MSASLQIDSLSVAAARRTLLDGICAGVQAGRLTAWVGPNGAGKTTLIRASLGLIAPGRGVPRRVGGSVMLDGRDVAEVSAVERARRMAYVPQRGAELAGFTAAEVVRWGGHASEIGGGGAVAEALEQVGLAGAAWGDRAFGSLSGGERQRVLLARAAVQLRGMRAPGIALCDEPLSALDPRHAGDALRLMRGWADAGAAVVVVLHNLNAALRHCDDAWLLSEGRLVSSGSAEEVLVPERLTRVYGVKVRRVPDGAGAVLVTG